MLRNQITTAAAHLSDDELMRELQCAERYASCTTRNRRDLALLCARCLREELERRHAAGLSYPHFVLKPA